VELGLHGSAISNLRRHVSVTKDTKSGPWRIVSYSLPHIPPHIPHIPHTYLTYLLIHTSHIPHTYLTPRCIAYLSPGSRYRVIAVYRVGTLSRVVKRAVSCISCGVSRRLSIAHCLSRIARAIARVSRVHRAVLSRTLPIGFDCIARAHRVIACINAAAYRVIARSVAYRACIASTRACSINAPALTSRAYISAVSRGQHRAVSRGIARAYRIAHCFIALSACLSRIIRAYIARVSRGAYRVARCIAFRPPYLAVLIAHCIRHHRIRAYIAPNPAPPYRAVSLCVYRVPYRTYHHIARAYHYIARSYHFCCIAHCIARCITLR
jgi:hypothetical protein